MAELPMFPLGTVLFPHGLLPLHVFEPRYRLMTKRVLQGDQEFGVVLIERGSEVGGGDARFDVATLARVVRAQELPDGRYALTAAGIRRVRVAGWLSDDPYPRAYVEPIAEVEGADPLSARTRMVEAFAGVVELARRIDARIASPPTFDADPGRAAYEAAAHAPIGPLDAQQLLAAADTTTRLVLLTELLDEQADQLRATTRPRVTQVTRQHSVGTLRAMTSFDEEQARARLGNERARVEGLIENLRSEGLDQEEADQSGDITHYDQHPADSGSETFEREKDLAILEGLESELAEIEAALAAARRGHVRRRRGDGQADRPRSARRDPDRAYERLQRQVVIVRLRLFATAREAAGCSADTLEVADGSSLDEALAVAVERYGATFADVLAGAGVWVNGDEPPAGAATTLRDGDEVAVLPPVSGGGAVHALPDQELA